nr:hypothetical protein [Nitrospirota bacterium]
MLSFLPADREAEAERLWGDRFVGGRELAQVVRLDARREYVDLIARIGATPIGGRTLRQAMKGLGGYSRWWFLKTTEKDCVWDEDVTYTTIIRLLCVKLAADRYRPQRIRLFGGPHQFALALMASHEVIPERPVRQAPWMVPILLVGLLSRFWLLFYYCRLWWHLRWCAPVEQGEFDVLLEGYWDWSVGPGADGRLRDKYFSDLPEKLAAHGLRVGWMTWYEPGVASWQKGRPLGAVVRSAAQRRDTVVLERQLSLRDIVGIVFRFRYLGEFLHFDRQPSFRSLFQVAGFDLHHVMRGPMLRLLAGSNLCRWDLLAAAATKACSVARPKLILTFLELITHSRAVRAGARTGFPTTKLWNVQHAGYASDKTFGMVDPRIELSGQPDGCPIPAPDGIFVMGELSESFWRRNGFRKEQVILTGGLRYQHVRVESRPCVQAAAPTVLLVVGMNAELDLDMCAAVSAATRYLPSVRLRLRDHPHYLLSSCAGFDRFRDRIEVTAGSPDDDLRSADLVVFTHSGMAEEAFLKGIPAWQWLWAGFNTSVFLDLPVIPTFTSVAELQQALRSFHAAPDRYRPKRETQELVMRQCFGPDPAGASERICAKILDLVGAPVVSSTIQSAGIA